MLHPHLEVFRKSGIGVLLLSPMITVGPGNYTGPAYVSSFPH